MRVAHVLRKYNPAEWGGTETALLRLLECLRQQGVESVIHCPRLEEEPVFDPLARCGATVRRFDTCVPVWGIPAEERRRMIAVGGNLMSFDLLRELWRAPDVDVIHTHTLGRLGGIAMTCARLNKLPFVVTIHGGALDLPEGLKRAMQRRRARGFEWGRAFGLLFGARKLFDRADAILTCNPKEAGLLRARHPGRRVEVQPHGIPVRLYREDHRAQALEMCPDLRSRRVLLAAGRVDPVKNQLWLVEQAPEILRRHPDVILVLAGACTDSAYGATLSRRMDTLGVRDRVLLTGGFPSADPRLIGLFQVAKAVVLPSVSETFGLVILEAWAAGAPVIASNTSGASSLVRHGQDGWLFDLSNAVSFHDALDWTLLNEDQAARMAAAARERVGAEFDNAAVAARLKRLYEELIEEKQFERWRAPRFRRSRPHTRKEPTCDT